MSQPSHKYLPGLTGLLFAVIFFTALFGAGISDRFNMLQDSDVCWLIKTGEWIINNQQIPTSNIFDNGINLLTRPLLCYQWLFEVLLGSFSLWLGLHGVVFISALMLALSFIFAGLWLYQKGFKGIPGIVTSLLCAAVILSIYWVARPYLLTLLFTTIFLWLYEKRLPLKQQWVFFPLLFLVWANSHLGFVAGLAIFFCSVYSDKKQQTPLLLWLACIVATAINPHGFQLFGYLNTLGQSDFMNRTIAELQPPDFSTPPVLLFFLMLGTSFIVSLFKKDSRIGPGEKAMLLMAAALGMHSQRHLFLPVIIGMPFIASLFDYPLKKYDTFFPAEDENPWATILVCSLLGLILAAFHVFPAQLNQKDLSTLKGVSNYLNEHPVKEPILMPGNWGSYILYLTSSRGTLDSRFDMYGDLYVRRNTEALEMKPGWQKFFKEAGIHYVLAPQNSTPIRHLKETQHWQVLYQDRAVTLLHAPG